MLKATKKSFLCYNQNIFLLRPLIVLYSSWVCGGSRFLLYTLLYTPTIAQDCWLSRADIYKLIKLKYYQAHNELISMAIMPVMSLLQIVWISLPRVFILLKCHHFGISRSFREICFEYSLMLRSSHLQLLNTGKVEIWTPGFLCNP